MCCGLATGPLPFCIIHVCSGIFPVVILINIEETKSHIEVENLGKTCSSEVISNAYVADSTHSRKL